MTLQQKSTWMRVLPIGITIVLFAVSLISTTLAITKSQEADRMEIQISNILVVIGEMQKVDADLALQIEKNRGERTVDIAILKARIDNIGVLLEDIKMAIMGIKR